LVSTKTAGCLKIVGKCWKGFGQPLKRQFAEYEQ